MADPGEPQEPKETVSHYLPVSAVRAIEYRAFLDRTTKSEALTTLIRAGEKALDQRTPPEERVA